MAEPRKHHYVPQFYLRHFSNDGNSICQIPKIKRTATQPASYTSAIADTAAVRDFHRLDYDGADDPNAVEKNLAAIESTLAKTLASVIESGINDETRESLALLVSLLMIRVPRSRSFIEESVRAAVRATGLLMERKDEPPPVPDALKEILSFKNVQINIHNWICVAHMFNLACDSKILGLLSSMHMSLWRTDGHAELLTSDNPVSIYRADATRDDYYGTGIGDSRVEISVPISRHLLLLLKWKQDAQETGTLAASSVREYNRRTVTSADKVVFASTSNETFVRMVDEFRHCSTSIRIETADCDNQFFHLMSQWPVMPQEQYRAAE